MNRKSQVTIFIIAGLVLVISAGFLMYQVNQGKKNQLISQAYINSKEAAVVKDYLEHIARDLLVEGIILSGKQGGKIYKTTWPDCKEDNPSYFQASRQCEQKGFYDYKPNDYLSDAPYRFRRVPIGIESGRTGQNGDLTQTFLPLSPVSNYLQPDAYPDGGQVGTAYLYGLNTPLPRIYKTAGEGSIEAGLAKFVKVHFVKQLDFREFEKAQYEIITRPGDPEVTVQINEEDITANFIYPVKFSKARRNYTLNDYSIKVKYNFKRMYKFVNDLIQKDTTTLENITTFKMVNKDGIVIGEVFRDESFSKSSPTPNYKYDVINVTDKSYNFKEMHGTDEEYFSFLFIRENRAPDASTVYYDPNPYYYDSGKDLVFYCPNDQVNDHDGSSLLDPDEDDVGTNEYKPGTGFMPKWYYWETEGVKSKKIIGGTCSVDGEVKYTAFDVVPIPKTNSRLKKLIEDGRFLLCGNVQKKVNLDGFGPEDVGDYISLTVGDQMSFLNSPGPQRLSDKITFRPVQCNPKTKNNGCCQNGYWKIGKPCEEFIDNSCSDCPIVKGCIDDPDNNKVCPRECKPPKLPKRCDDKGDCVGP